MQESKNITPGKSVSAADLLIETATTNISTYTPSCNPLQETHPEDLTTDCGPSAAKVGKNMLGLWPIYIQGKQKKNSYPQLRTLKKCR